MPYEYMPGINKLIARSLEAAKQGRYAYICIQFEDDEGDHSITYRSDRYQKTETIEVEDENKEQH